MLLGIMGSCGGNDSAEKKSEFKSVIIKNSIHLVLGRYHADRLALYGILNRLVLLVQKPLAFIIYDGENNSIYKSLDCKGNIGDPELAEIFENYVRVMGGDIIEDNLFCLFGKKSEVGHRICFVEILHDTKDIFGTRFNIIKRDSADGQLLVTVCESIHDDFAKAPEHIPFRSIENGISDAIKRIATRHKIINDPGCRALTEKANFVDIERLLSPVKNELLSAVYKRIQYAPLVQYGIDGSGEVVPLPYSNIFFVIRTATTSRFGGKFSYTERIVLPKEHRKEVKRHFDGLLNKQHSCPWYSAENNDCVIPGINKCIQRKYSESDDIVGILETPLSDESRSIFDSAFMSGIVEFAQYPDLGRDRTLAHGFSHETDRQAVMYCVFHQLLFPQKAELIGRQTEKVTALIVPMQVSGALWAAALTFNLPTRNNNDFSVWHNSFAFYAAIISRTISRKLRYESEVVYLQQVEAVFAEEMDDSITTASHEAKFNVGQFVAKTNKRYRELCQIYPYALVEICQEFNQSEDKDVITLMTPEAQISFSLHVNPNFGPLSGVEYITKDKVRTSLLSGYVKAAAKVSSAFLKALSNGA